MQGRDYCSPNETARTTIDAASRLLLSKQSDLFKAARNSLQSILLKVLRCSKLLWNDAEQRAVRMCSRSAAGIGLWNDTKQ